MARLELGLSYELGTTRDEPKLRCFSNVNPVPEIVSLRGTFTDGSSWG